MAKSLSSFYIIRDANNTILERFSLEKAQEAAYHIIKKVDGYLEPSARLEEDKIKSQGDCLVVGEEVYFPGEFFRVWGDAREALVEQLDKVLAKDSEAARVIRSRIKILLEARSYFFRVRRRN